ncbi:MAG: AEC family transporter [Deltaproteobacteria bacterium]|nr:AEC family transporter [Deltaproteobacteria bacterium]
MLHILETIVPVFLVILVGVMVRRFGFLPANMTVSLNRLVYYVAIPAMIFQALATASFSAQFRPEILVGTLVPVGSVFVAAIVIGRALSIPRDEMGTFIQSSVHGNLGYIGFAVAFYLLGEEGFTRASILAGFLMLLQNLLSVVGLQAFSGGSKGRSRLGTAVKTVGGNPVILSLLASVAFNLSGLPLPVIVGRTLKIVSGMALPMALLVIGASLSFGLVRNQLRYVLASAGLKLVVLPAAGLLLFRLMGIPEAGFLPGLILLAAPAATVSYVMAVELGGSPDQASAAVSMSTLLSSATYVVWLGLLHYPG